MSILTVGAGQQFSTLSAAIAASHDGDTINVSAGTYTNDFATINHKVSIVGIGGMARLVATEPPTNGKAILVTNADVTLQNIEFSGAHFQGTSTDPANQSENASGIRYQAGNLVVDHCVFNDSDCGILAASNSAGTILIDHSEFLNQNVASDGNLAHQVYVNQIGHLTIQNSYFHDNENGHHIKSRADVTDIHNNVIVDANGTTSYDVDAPTGGNVSITGNTIVKGPNAQNPIIIDYGAEGNNGLTHAHPTNSLDVQDNLIADLQSGGIGVRNASGTSTAHGTMPLTTAHIDGDQFYNVKTIAMGANEQTDDATLAAAPHVQAVSPWDAASHTLLGAAGLDVLMAGAGADTLNGGAGNDWLYGGSGNDTFVVDKGDGSDTIFNFHAGDVAKLGGYGFADFSAVHAAMSQTGSDVTLNLGGGETLLFKDHAVADFTAAEFGFSSGSTGGAPTPTPAPAPAPAPTPAGSTGSTDPGEVQPFTLPTSDAWIHTFTGTSHADVLTGTSGNDFLNGEASGDKMIGGAGDDTYIVDNRGDVVVEKAGGGTDTAIVRTLTYTLADNVENATLQGSVAHTFSGNGLDNLITATPYAADKIDGGAGNDVINAGRGADVLTGGTGHDMFAFSSLPSGAASHVTDFHVGEDLLDLRPLMKAYAGTDPIADHVLALVSDRAGGTMVEADPTHSGTMHQVVDLQGVVPSAVRVGTDLLWHH